MKDVYQWGIDLLTAMTNREITVLTQSDRQLVAAFIKELERIRMKSKL